MRHRFEQTASALPIVLFGIWPFVSFLNHNQEDALIYGSRIISYGIAFVTLLAVVSLVAKAVLRHVSMRRIANTLAVAVVIFFSYLPIENLLSGLGITLGTVKIGIWFLVLVVVVAAVWRVSRIPATSTVVNVMGCVMVAVPAAQLVWFAIQNAGAVSAVVETGANSASARPVPTAAMNRPNVYWFILDMYARADILEEYLDYNNADFLRSLNARGFFVAEEAFSNFTGTSLSVSTTLNMQHYPTGERLQPSMWATGLDGFNATVDRFVELGYRYIQAEPGANRKTRCGGREHLCITALPRGAFGITEAEVGLLKLTPLYRIIRRLFPNLFSFDFTTVRYVVAKLEPRSSSPFFAFAHIRLPHPPTRYNPDCTEVEQFDWNLVGPDTKEAVTQYLTDLRCLNQEVVTAIDVIISNDQSDPIIVIQGDHGVGLGFLNVESKDRATELWRVPYAILHAMRLPARCRDLLAHKFSLVNTFRVVFSCLEERNIELLPNRLFNNRGGIITEQASIE